MRMAKRVGFGESTVRMVAQEFHWLLRLHSKLSRLSAKCKKQGQDGSAESLQILCKVVLTFCYTNSRWG